MTKRLNQFTSKPITEQMKDKIIFDYTMNEKSVLSISKDVGIGYSRIQRLLKKEGIDIRGNDFTARKYKYDVNFFDEIDTEEKAYWFGFIYADGYITKRGNTHQLGITLSTKDRGHLEKFVKSLNSNMEIHDYVHDTTYKKDTEYSRVIVSNNHICEQLMNKGCHRSKTNIIEFPSEDILPKHLTHHFIRGYFDGDGCLTGSFHKKRNVHVYRVKIMGTKEFLGKVNDNLPISKELYLTQRYDDMKANNYMLEIGGKNQVDTIMKYLYNNATIFLDRKNEKYEESKILS